MSLRKTGMVGGAVVATVMLVGCSAPKKEVAPAAAPAPAPVSAPAPKLAVSLNAAMVRLVDHSAHDLWELERKGKQPKTDDDWADVEHHATQMVLAGSLIRLEGTGVHDKEWVADEKWQTQAKALSDAGLAALKAAQEKNFEGVVTANGQLVEVCEACHKAFKPALPSEGIVHKHAH